MLDGEISKEAGLEEGYRILDEEYRAQLAELNEWVLNRGLTHPVLGNEDELLQGLEEAKERWAGIVADVA